MNCATLVAQFVRHMAQYNNDPLHLVVEIKGYRREDAKAKKATMDTYWVSGVNNLNLSGRWAFAEFGDMFLMGADFREKVEAEFSGMIAVLPESKSTLAY